MPGPWFLLVFFANAAHLIEEVSTSSAAWDDEPSCDELRSMWLAITQAASKSELTNEIPLVPAYVEAGHRQRNAAKGRRKNVHHTEHNLLTNVIHGPFVEEGPPLPDLHHQLLPERIPAAIPLGPTRKKFAQSESTWGLPEEVGMFGKFVDFDSDYPMVADRHFGNPYREGGQEPCFQVLNQDCTMDEQCICIGWNTLQCIKGKCNSQQLKSETENEHGSWHDGPLPLSRLGRLKRSKKPTSM